MSVIADDGIIDQSEYEEFAGVPDRHLNEEPDDGFESSTVSDASEISPNWQLATEHTFVQEHFCKVTSCTSTALGGEKDDFSCAERHPISANFISTLKALYGVFMRTIKLTFCFNALGEYCGNVIAAMRWHQGLRCRGSLFLSF